MNCRASLGRADLDLLFEPFTRGFLFFVFLFFKFLSHFITKKFNSTEKSPDPSGSSGVFYTSSLTTHSVVPGPSVSEPPGSFLEMQNLGPTLDLQN